MAVRNFYIEADIDGRQTILSGGPARKDGGMRITITQRDDGAIRRAFTIACREYGGELQTTVICDGDKSVDPITFKTKR